MQAGRHGRTRRPLRRIGQRPRRRTRRAFPPARRELRIARPASGPDPTAGNARYRRASPGSAGNRRSCRKWGSESTPFSPSYRPCRRRFFPCSFPCSCRPRRSRRRRLIGRGGLLVRLAAVVGLVEARPLEDDRRPGTDQPPQLQLAALRALALGIGAHRLKQLELVLAGLANVIVGRHGYPGGSVSEELALETITWLGRTTRSNS